MKFIELKSVIENKVFEKKLAELLFHRKRRWGHPEWFLKQSCGDDRYWDRGMESQSSLSNLHPSGF